MLQKTCPTLSVHIRPEVTPPSSYLDKQPACQIGLPYTETTFAVSTKRFANIASANQNRCGDYFDCHNTNKNCYHNYTLRKKVSDYKTSLLVVKMLTPFCVYLLVSYYQTPFDTKYDTFHCRIRPFLAKLIEISPPNKYIYQYNSLLMHIP